MTPRLARLGHLIRQGAQVGSINALARIPGAAETGQQVALQGAGLGAESIVRAYVAGYFPMPTGGGMLTWVSPDPRAMIPIDAFHVPRNLARLTRQARYEVRIDSSFAAVIRACAEREQTWLTPPIISAHEALHALGFAHSVEVWQDAELVGGVYGIAIGRFFSTESQFHRVRDAGKVAFVTLSEVLRHGGYVLHDVQYRSAYLEQFGCIELSRVEYRERLLGALAMPARFALPEALVAPPPR